MDKLQLICPKRNGDYRGFFAEIYNQRQYLNYKIDDHFVQDNLSLSEKIGTIRGLHFQAPPYAQAKLVSCVHGAIFDVAVDIRKGSPTFGNWKGYELSSDNSFQLYIPIGFAHGFKTLEPNSVVIYKCSNYYAPEAEGSLLWNDPDIGIQWPSEFTPILSSKDTKAELIKDFNNPFIYGENS